MREEPSPRPETGLPDGHEPGDDRGPPVHPAVWGLVVALIAIEGILWICDQGALPRLRWLLYRLLSVGAVHWETATSSGAEMTWFMTGIVVHGIVHTGWMHVLTNAVGLLCFGHVVQRQAGTWVFLLVLAAGLIGGAAAFLMLSDPTDPAARMTGSSGAVFALFAMVLGWSRDRALVLRLLVLMVVIHLPVVAQVLGQVAWQAHLGGGVAGFVLAWIIRPKRRFAHPLM